MYKVPIIKLIHLTILRLIQTKRTKFCGSFHSLNVLLFFATHRLIMKIICGKLFSNSTMHNKVMGRTRTGFTGLCTKFKCGL